MERRRVSVSKLNGDHISSVLRGEIIEVTYQERPDAILIRRPQNAEEIARLVEELELLIATFKPSEIHRGRKPENKDV